jgi:RNA methyltransferase, TrmH family
MLSHNQIKLITSLKLKKFREEKQLFAAEGTKVVPELINGGFRIYSVYAKENWIAENSAMLSGKVDREKLHSVSDKELERISNLSTPNEVVALFEIPDKKLELSALKSQLVLMIDEVKDPGNMGTIIRIADWFGIKTIICSENSVDIYNPKTIQSTMGSLGRVDVFYENLSVLLTENKDSLKLPVYGALLEGENIYFKKLSETGIILMGSESHGISQNLLPFIDHKITIPRFGMAESLNVSAATAIIVSEFKRLIR